MSRDTEQEILDRAARASEAELRELWVVWRRLTLANLRRSPARPVSEQAEPPWHRAGRWLGTGG